MPKFPQSKFIRESTVGTFAISIPKKKKNKKMRDLLLGKYQTQFTGQ